MMPTVAVTSFVLKIDIGAKKSSMDLLSSTYRSMPAHVPLSLSTYVVATLQGSINPLKWLNGCSLLYEQTASLCSV